jgi:hypothetical protein
LGERAAWPARVKFLRRVVQGFIEWPAQRVMKRLSNGAEESVTAYAAALGVDPGNGRLRACLIWAVVDLGHDPVS